MKGTYLATQLKNRLKSKGLSDKIEASTGGGYVYLERKAAPPESET